MPIGDDDFMKAMQELDDISAQGYTPEPMENRKLNCGRSHWRCVSVGH